MTSPLRIAHIGCGRISAKHFEALEKIQDKFTVVGVCDIDFDKANIEGDTILTTQKILSAIYQSNNTKLPVSLS